jgi:hypothetical protein
LISYSSQRKSLRKLLIFDAITLFIGIAFIICQKLSHTRPCITKTLLKIYCPACGGTRAISSLLRFDIIDSIRHNPIVLYIAACIVLVNVLGVIAIAKKKSNIFCAWRPLVYGGIVILAVFFVIKNVLMIFFKIDLSNELINYWM